MITQRVNRTFRGYEVEIVSTVFAKSVYLQCKGAEGRFSDNFFDLFPEEPRVVEFESVEEVPEFEKKLKVMSLVDAY
jgi:beta-mannosidase